MKILEPKEIKIMHLEEFSDADIEFLGPTDHWRFFSEPTGRHLVDELYAEYIGPDDIMPDGIVLVWYGGKEQYWGTVKMNPYKYVEINGMWRKK